ncbi:hypothetical protein Tco_1455605 [Tanacetum coccineum]
MTRKLDDMIELPKSQPKRTYNEDLECEIVMVKMPKCMAWLDDEPLGDLDMMEDKLDNPSPQGTPQFLSSVKVHSPPVTHPDEVEETIGILLEFPSVDEPEPQPLPNLPFLDVNLADKRGTDPPINPYSPGKFSSKMKNEFLQSVETASRFTCDAITGTLVTRLYLMRRSLEVLRKFHWMILGGRFNQLSHVSSPLLSKPGEY